MKTNPPTDYKDYKCTSAFMRINCSTLFAGVNYTVYMYMYYMYIGQRIRLESLNNRLIIHGLRPELCVTCTFITVNHFELQMYLLNSLC